MQITQQQRISAVFLAILILVSSVGWSSYARYCSCANEVYTSLFAKNEGTCCKHHAAQKAKAAPKHSCCSLQHTKEKALSEEDSCKKSDNCCHTQVKYMALDADATLAQAALDLPNLLTDWNFSAKTNLLYPNFIRNYSLSNYDKGMFLPNAPPPKSGRQLLQFIQVMRC
jgi:hypothetical protein